KRWPRGRGERKCRTLDRQQSASAALLGRCIVERPQLRREQRLLGRRVRWRERIGGVGGIVGSGGGLSRARVARVLGLAGVLGIAVGLGVARRLGLAALSGVAVLAVPRVLGIAALGIAGLG